MLASPADSWKERSAVHATLVDAIAAIVEQAAPAARAFERIRAGLHAWGDFVRADGLPCAGEDPRHSRTERR